MNAYSGLADLFRSHTVTRLKQQQPVRLVPRTAADELPAYPEQMSIMDGGRQGSRRRELDPLAAFAASDQPCARATLYGR